MKTLSNRIAVLLVFVLLFSVNVSANNEIYINGMKIEVEAVNENGRILVPVRGVFEYLGYEVDYETETKTAVLAGEKRIIMTSGDDYFSCDGRTIKPDVPQKIINSRFYIPLRAVAEVLGCEVSWSNDTKSVHIMFEMSGENARPEPQPEIQPEPQSEPQPEPQQEPQSELQSAPQPELEQQQQRQPESQNETSLSDSEISEKERAILDLTNKEREKAGLNPLEWDDNLAAAAHKHSVDMAQNDYMDHYSPDGKTPFDRMEKEGAKFGTMGENVAAGRTSPEDTIKMWMDSPGHKANILNPDYEYLGVGFAASPDSTYTYYWTQCFGGINWQ